MIIVDTALERRAAENNPIRVAMVGAGFMARCSSRPTVLGLLSQAFSNNRIRRSTSSTLSSTVGSTIS